MNERFLSFGQQKRFKLIIVGDSNVGKTSLFWKYTEGEFLAVKETQITTIDFKMKNVNIKDQLVKLYIWDTAGQQKFRSIVSTYFKGCHGILLVFDETNPESFDNLTQRWYPLCLSKTEGAKMVLVGNKVDLQRSVDQQQIKNWSQKHNIKYFPTSVKQNKNVDQVFMQLILLNLKKDKQQKSTIEHNNFEKSQSFNVGAKNKTQQAQSKKKKCC